MNVQFYCCLFSYDWSGMANVWSFSSWQLVKIIVCSRVKVPLHSWSSQFHSRNLNIWPIPYPCITQIGVSHIKHLVSYLCFHLISETRVLRFCLILQDLIEKMGILHVWRIASKKKCLHICMTWLGEWVCSCGLHICILLLPLSAWLLCWTKYVVYHLIYLDFHSPTSFLIYISKRINLNLIMNEQKLYKNANTYFIFGYNIGFCCQKR